MPHRPHTFAPVLIAFTLAGCQTQDAEPNVGGESHWLTNCTASALCPGDSLCLCGVCTLPCSDQDACTDLDTCAPSNDTCDVQACQPTCDDTTPCAQGATCVDNTCQSDTTWRCNGTQHATALESGATLISGPQDTQGAENCATLSDGSGVHCDSAPAIVDALLLDDQITFKICSPSQLAQHTLEATEGTLTISPSEGGVFSIEDQLSLPEGLQLEASRVTLRGEGPTPTLRADLTVRASNARVRRLTIDGDVGLQPSSNGAALVDVHIKGSLRVQANNVALLRVTIDGDLLIEGNQATLLAVDVQGAATLGNNPLCDDTADQGSLCPPP